MKLASILCDSKPPYSEEISVIDKRVAGYSYMLSRAKQNLVRCRYSGGVGERYSHGDLNLTTGCVGFLPEVKA
jgi:hypothetical protein